LLDEKKKKAMQYFLSLLELSTASAS